VKNDPEAYVTREAIVNKATKAFSVDVSGGRTIGFSSVGDVDVFAEEALRDIHPANGSTNRKITLLDVCLSVRNISPLIITNFFQFNGRLLITLQGCERYASAEDMTTYTVVFRKWLDRLTSIHLEKVTKTPDLTLSSRL
jgi:hypothetical protein